MTFGFPVDISCTKAQKSRQEHKKSGKKDISLPQAKFLNLEAPLIYAIFERLPGFEHGCSRSGDIDCLPRARIASSSRRAILHFKRTKAYEPYLVSLLHISPHLFIVSPAFAASVAHNSVLLIQFRPPPPMMTYCNEASAYSQ